MTSPLWQPAPSIRAAAPDEVETTVAGADGTRLYLRRRGGDSPGSLVGVGQSDAPVALLCDGIACDGFIWKYLWDDLAAFGPVAHWNYRGHGRSAPGVDPDRVRVVDFAADLDCVRRALGDPPIVLVGHSFGVQVALEGYRLRPEGVRGLVLCCGSSGRITDTFKGSNALAQVLPRIVSWTTDHPEIARALWSYVPTELSLKLSFLLREVDVDNMKPADLMPYLRHMTTIDFPFFVRALKAAGEHDAEDLLPQIRVPTIVIAAERDSFTPAARAQALANGIPGATFEMLKGGSHAALIEQEVRVRELVGAFLTGLSEGTSHSSEQIIAKLADVG